MKCPKCKEELAFSKSALSKMNNCPFCGAELKKKNEKKTKISASQAIKSVIDDFGVEVFNRENESRLRKILMDWPEEIALDRDRLLMLLIKRIPQRLCESLDLPKKERLPVVLQSVECLVNEFKFSQEVALEHVKLFSDALGLDSSIKIKEDIPTEFVDPRDGEKYRLVKIGKQLWFAENFRHVCEGSTIYDGNDLYWVKYGCLYNHQSALDHCPGGWRLPSEQDFRNLLREAGNNELSLMKWAKNGFDKDIAGCDDLKFSMLPGGCRSREGKYFMRGQCSDGFVNDDENVVESAGRKGVLWLSSAAKPLKYDPPKRKRFMACKFYFDGPLWGNKKEICSHLQQVGCEEDNYYSVRYVKDI